MDPAPVDCYMPEKRSRKKIVESSDGGVLFLFEINVFVILHEPFSISLTFDFKQMNLLLRHTKKVKLVVKPRRRTTCDESFLPILMNVPG